MRFEYAAWSAAPRVVVPRAVEAVAHRGDALVRVGVAFLNYGQVLHVLKPAMTRYGAVDAVAGAIRAVPPGRNNDIPF